MSVLTIAIDGPVSSGKSSVSDEVAKRLGLIHLDTGAMYRALGLAAARQGIDMENERDVVSLCENGEARIDVRYESGRQVTLLNGEDVSNEIREQRIGDAASMVSRYKGVRAFMVRKQQEIAGRQDILIDGRDICTVVLPDAKVKIYLTATPEERARRRQNQLAEKGQAISFAKVLEEINMRDWQDTHREADPLRIADDAVVIDNTGFDFEQSVRAVLDLVAEAQNE